MYLENQLSDAEEENEMLQGQLAKADAKIENYIETADRLQGV